MRETKRRDAAFGAVHRDRSVLFTTFCAPLNPSVQSQSSCEAARLGWHVEGNRIGRVAQSRNTKGLLILFLGNAMLSDDRIGLILGEMLKEKLESEGYEVEILERAGFSLIDYLENRDKAVIVDSVRTGRHHVGQVVCMNLDDLEQYAPFTPHYVGISEALRLMRQLDLNPPRHLRILAIEVEDAYTISENISEKLKGRLNDLAQEIHKMILSSVHSTTE